MSGEAQNFANDSLMGTYAVTIETKSVEEIGIGVCTADGLPNATGSASLRCPILIINQQDNQGREIVTASLIGSYTINSNGMGTMSVVLSQTSQATTPFVINTNLDLLVTMSRTPTGNAVQDAAVIHGAQIEGARQITKLGGEELVIYKFEKLD